ncbi:MAG: hypothetical protein ABL911_12705 [Gallionella sp.]|nr:hypothetical protein [Gallionella sp.]
MPIGFNHGIAKQFAPVVDCAVAVFVHDEQPIAGRNPARTLFDAVAIVIEQDGVGGVDADSL